MLTIKNPRIDLEDLDNKFDIEGFTLVDAGLSNIEAVFLPKAKTEYPYYMFDWSYGDRSRLFRVILAREKRFGKYYIEIHKQNNVDRRLYNYVMNQPMNMDTIRNKMRFYTEMVRLMQKNI